MLFLFYFVFSAEHFPPSRGCRCGHLPSRVFAVSSRNPPPCRWPEGGFLHYFSLVLAPVFPSTSTKARLAIVPFLWLVCRRAFPAPPPATTALCGRFYGLFYPPPRYTGGTQQVFDGWLLPCCRVCVSFDCFSSRISGSLARLLEMWEWVLRSRIFDSWSSSYNRSFPEPPIFLHIYAAHQGGLVLRYGLERPVIIRIKIIWMGFV